MPVLAATTRVPYSTVGRIDIYVNPDAAGASDDNFGTIVSPFATLSRAWDAIADKIGRNAGSNGTVVSDPTVNPDAPGVVVHIAGSANDYDWGTLTTRDLGAPIVIVADGALGGAFGLADESRNDLQATFVPGGASTVDSIEGVFPGVNTYRGAFIIVRYADGDYDIRSLKNTTATLANVAHPLTQDPTLLGVTATIFLPVATIAAPPDGVVTPAVMGTGVVGPLQSPGTQSLQLGNSGAIIAGKTYVYLIGINWLGTGASALPGTQGSARSICHSSVIGYCCTGPMYNDGSSIGMGAESLLDRIGSPPLQQLGIIPSAETFEGAGWTDINFILSPGAPFGDTSSFSYLNCIMFGYLVTAQNLVVFEGCNFNLKGGSMLIGVDNFFAAISLGGALIAESSLTIAGGFTNFFEIETPFDMIGIETGPDCSVHVARASIDCASTIGCLHAKQRSFIDAFGITLINAVGGGCIADTGGFIDVSFVDVTAIAGDEFRAGNTVSVAEPAAGVAVLDEAAGVMSSISCIQG